MKFVKTYDLKPGMRLAKPIYNRNGVLLYDRNTPITLSSIKNVQNFGLIGIYVLDPAEPLPPMSKEDIEFEQNQTVYLFKLRDCFSQLLKQEEMNEFQNFINNIITRYGMLDHRVNFNQNLRSSEDYIYKHAISTSILSAMISHTMKIQWADQLALVAAALLFDLGLSFVPKAILEKGNSIDDEDNQIVVQALEKGLIYLEHIKKSYSFMPKAYALIEYYIFMHDESKSVKSNDSSIVTMANILKVADKFDTLTGMTMGYEPKSEIAAMNILRESPDDYDPKIVSALAQSIHIIPAGSSVDLNNDEKAIVLEENLNDYMHPLILKLSDNQVYDLSDPLVSSKIQIMDLMKTLDNRVHIDKKTLQHFVADERIRNTAIKFRRTLYGHD